MAWLIDVKRHGLKPASWRQYRSAAVFVLLKAAGGKQPRTLQIFERLRSAGPSPGGSLPKTSAKKAKHCSASDADRIVARAYADGAKNARGLALFVRAARITGLRPSEWPFARLEEMVGEAGAWRLIVACAKHDAVRAHSATRTLIYRNLPAADIRALQGWLKVVADAVSTGRYRNLQSALSSLMYRTAKAVFPRRMRRPTLYSFRHEAAADFKAAYTSANDAVDQRLAGAAKVAALLGHASDLTATQHYARPRGKRGSGRAPVPEPEPAEVARVRRRLQESHEKRLRPRASKVGASF
ncbi:hypothetical protein ACIKTA_03420 [Hansschlegelia beijingensis]|uniref:hypothetical protein n=1 Tax=Hansschlegelia beijingensis TaxID=1133344 RepID=UPI0037F989F7